MYEAAEVVMVRADRWRGRHRIVDVSVVVAVIAVVGAVVVAAVVAVAVVAVAAVAAAVVAAVMSASVAAGALGRRAGAPPPGRVVVVLSRP